MNSSRLARIEELSFATGCHHEKEMGTRLSASIDERPSVKES
jgi:hypothetical protein